MNSLRRKFGWTLVGVSLLLHIVSVFAFSRQPDRLAAFTVVPIWFWGGIGLFLTSVAFYFLRAPLSLVLSAVWVVTVLVGADEAHTLTHFGKSPPLAGPPAAHRGSPVIRAVTLNCANFNFGNPATDLAAWQPDIVILQQLYPHQVRQIADVLFAGRGDYRAHAGTGVVSRWKITREFRPVGQRIHLVTLELPGGRTLEVANLHLTTAATDLRLWNPDAWREHRQKRLQRRHELAIILSILSQQTAFPQAPTLLGGDFNTPAGDPAHLLLARDFTDAFTAAGTGWGNTFQRRVPILRIDHLYATRHLTPVRAKAHTTLNSDHRMVIADYLTR